MMRMSLVIVLVEIMSYSYIHYPYAILTSKEPPRGKVTDVTDVPVNSINETHSTITTGDHPQHINARSNFT